MQQDSESGGLPDRIPKAKRAEPPEPDERDATIERLEGELAEERERCAELAAAADSLQFKLEVQEKGYAKQLADARLATQEAERKLAEVQAALAELESTHEETLRSLQDARGRLERITAGTEASGAWAPVPGQSAGRDFGIATGDTINRLLTAATDPMEDPREQRRPAAKRAPPEPEAPPEDLLAPEVVFARKADG